MDSEAEASFVPDFELTDVVNEYKLFVPYFDLTDVVNEYETTHATSVTESNQNRSSRLDQKHVDQNPRKFLAESEADNTK